jgi:hypothetical protein
VARINGPALLSLQHCEILYRIPLAPLRDPMAHEDSWILLGELYPSNPPDEICEMTKCSSAELVHLQHKLAALA